VSHIGSAAALEPGASVSAVAHEARIHPSQLYGWRRRLCTRPQAGFSAVRIAPESASASLPLAGVIEIEFVSLDALANRGV
jgi:transposase